MRFNENTLLDKNNKVVIKAFHSTVNPGKRTYSRHHHTECELSLFIKGSGVYTVGEKIYDFHSGDIFLYNSDEVHCITDIYADETCDLFNIHFEPRILYINGNSELLKLFFARNSKFENRIDRKNPSTAKIQKLMLELENELAKKEAGYEIMVQTLLNTILVTLLRKYDYTKNENVFLQYENSFSQIMTVLDYIDTHIEQNLTLSHLAKLANMSQTYFSTMFKKLNGISPWQYITIKRVEKSVELLKTTKMSKLEIASKCGFNSSSNFYKAFFNITGKKPSEYISHI